MNGTNRAANRLLILLVGVLMLVVGAAAAAAVLIPAVRDAWKGVAGPVQVQVSEWLRQTPLGDTGVSVVMPAVLVLLVAGVIVLIAFIVRQGGGHTKVAVEDAPGEHGRTVIESSFAEHALEDAIGARPEFVSSHVSTYRVRRTPVLKISVTCRRGVSPRDAATIVEDALRALDTLIGRQLPALVQISGGFRARTATTTRLQ